MNRYPYLRIVASVFLIAFASARSANAATSSDRIWRGVDQLPAAPASARVEIHPMAFKTFALDAGLLRSKLGKAPLEFNGRALKDSKLVVTLPMPDGTFARFQIEESPVMEAPLAAKYPAIKSYRGRGLDDRSASLRLDINRRTFHAQILTSSGAVYIDPYWQNDGRLYMSYFKKDLEPDTRQFKCDVGGSHQNRAVRPATESPAGSPGEMLLTYRLACATSIMYSQYHGGPTMVVEDILAALVTMVNRVSGVYETELAMKMVLVANNDQIIATVMNPTPFNDTPGDIFLNPAYLDTKIGAANYDIGHVVTTGSGGIAGLGVVCGGLDITFGGSAKAAGTTGINPPIGDPFWIDYVAHEMGHQFGGNHTFNGDGTNCGGTNQNAATAFEPGSGSTIQAYAGICGAANNLQPHSDPYFHFISLEEIFGYSVLGPGGECPVSTPTGNHAPTVSARGPGVPAFPAVAYKIPAQTPFSLKAFNGADPDSDSITYCWEEFDLGPVKAGTAPDNGSSPLFRSFNPTVDPTRTFPRWPDLLTNSTQTIGEKLPLTTRKLDFRVTVRDNRGGFFVDSIRLNVVNTSTGFAVTAPDTAVTWTGGATETATWNVAGTTGNGINTSMVNVLLSTDATPDQGDPVFPIVLAANVPNDGSETITVPMVNTAKARVMVQAVGNVYFDVSNTNFTITSPTAPQLTGVVSRKTHGASGAFDIDLPVTGSPGIECRNAGGNYTLVFSFGGDISSVESVTLVSIDGLATADAPVVTGGVVTVDLHNVANAQVLGVTLNNLNATGSNASVPMAVLVGDTTANGSVNSADIGQTKSQSGTTVVGSNFRQDVTVDGSINSSDISLVKSRSGTALP